MNRNANQGYTQRISDLNICITFHKSIFRNAGKNMSDFKEARRIQKIQKRLKVTLIFCEPRKYFRTSFRSVRNCDTFPLISMLLKSTKISHT
jgi:hypothetical protein